MTDKEYAAFFEGLDEQIVAKLQEVFGDKEYPECVEETEKYFLAAEKFFTAHLATIEIVTKGLEAKENNAKFKHLFNNPN